MCPCRITGVTSTDNNTHLSTKLQEVSRPFQVTLNPTALLCPWVLEQCELLRNAWEFPTKGGTSSSGSGVLTIRIPR